MIVNKFKIKFSLSEAMDILLFIKFADLKIIVKYIEKLLKLKNIYDSQATEEEKIKNSNSIVYNKRIYL